MCKAPKPPPVKEPDKPEFLRNRFLDAAFGRSGTIEQLRTGRSSLRIPLAGASALPGITTNVQNPLASPVVGPSAADSLPQSALSPVGLPGIAATRR